MGVVTYVTSEATTLMLTRLNKGNKFISPVLWHLTYELHAANTPVYATHLEMFVCEVTDCVLIICVV